MRQIAGVAVFAALVGAVVMSIKHIWGISLPGCGQTGGCDWAIRGPFSKVAGFPVAFLGTAFFSGLAVYQIISREAFAHTPYHWAVRLGALVSVVYISIMLTNGRICVWCSLTHVGNLIFWAVTERSARLAPRSARLVPSHAVYALLTGAMVFAIAIYAGSKTDAAARAENYRKGMASVARIGEDTAGTNPDNQPDPARFGGRYWEGTPDAPVRIVMFHDYECQLCKEAEAQIARLLRERPDVAFSVKQWPFDADCNRFILGASMHPGACHAAKVAEAAGIVGGETAFWSVHQWLVERGGEFSQVQLMSKIDDLRLDRRQFINALNSSKVDSMIRADVEEGMAFGLTFTPMLFVNGYRVEGWQSVGVLPAAIERAAAVAKLSPRTNDRPDLAITQQYREWLLSPVVALNLRNDEFARGPAQAGTTILVYGDLTCAFHASAYVMLQQALRDRKNVRYVFRDFPLDSTCNDLLPKQINAGACAASRWTIAAGLIGGDSAYWSAHEYIVYHRGKPEDLSVQKVAEAASVDPAALERAAAAPKVEQILSANISLAKQMKIDTSPTIYINGRMVKGWRTPGLLSLIISNNAQSGR